MRNSDDDCLEGVLCSSCKLAVNKDTGRLKWCMGGNNVWRARIRYMLLIPTIILPIMIIFIVLSRTNITDRIALHSTQTDEDNRLEGIIDRQRLISADNLEDESKQSVSNFELNSMLVERDDNSPNIQRQKRYLKRENPSSTDQINSDIPYSQVSSYNPNIITYDEDLDTLKELQTSSGYSDIDFDSDDENAMYEETTEIEVNDDDFDNVDDLEEDEVTDKAKKFVNDFDTDEHSGSEEEDYDIDFRQNPCENEDNEDIIFEDETWESVDDSVVDESCDFKFFWKGEKDDENKIRKQQANIMLKYMDRRANPCQDFHQYACGNWAKHNPIPKDKVGYDTFEMLRESLNSILKELLEEPIIRNPKISLNDAIIKAKHLYQSCMNYEIIEQRREKPLIKILDELGGWPILTPNWNSKNFDWLKVIAQLRLYNKNMLITERVGRLYDNEYGERYVIQFDEAMLGLPTRDYFLQPIYKNYLEAYRQYFIDIVISLGASTTDSINCADEIIEFETQLAKITTSVEEKRNSSEVAVKMNLLKLKLQVPEVDWQRYLTIVLDRKVKLNEPVVIFALKYIQNLVKLLSKTSPRIVSNYLLWRFVRQRVNNLDERFQHLRQKFYYSFFGREQMPPRWKFCLSQVNANLGMAVGALFVKRYFDENSKTDTLMIMRELQQSFREILNNTCWINDLTKELAIKKVDAMLLQIGYPDYILNPRLLNEYYEEVVINPEKYFENTLNILKYLTKVEQSRLGTPVNKTLWDKPPTVINAYYNRYKNQIIFPAGILQPPFYHKYYPKSLNYGGIGSIMGHEITHGFDNNGRLFDKNGNFNRWWNNKTIKGFQQRAQCLIDQYNRFNITEVNMQVNGHNTQAENIADNGGIKQAYNAYEKWLSTNSDAKENLPGMNLTGRQLFFLNFAQIWCGSLRVEVTRNRVKTDTHSPGKYRIIGTLSNFKKFAQAFKCPLGSPMNPVKKCSVW